MSIGKHVVLLIPLLALETGTGCLVKETCYSDADCPSGQVCRTASGTCEKTCRTDADCRAGDYCETGTGRCLEAECFADADCGTGMVCQEHRCRPVGELVCPDDMASIDNLFCMDIYEASRPDATQTAYGTDGSMATSRPGVLPWYSSHLDPVVARTACQNAGKRLCQLDEWIYACRGAENTDYTYGNDYDPAICNSIDTYCYCEQGTTCEDRDPCPFPHCREICGAYFTDEPTGFFPDCVDSWGVYDINGNVWELTETNQDSLLHFRGGAYNCGDSERLHRCDHDGTWGPSAQGFRCCSDGERVERGGGG